MILSGGEVARPLDIALRRFDSFAGPAAPGELALPSSSLPHADWRPYRILVGLDSAEPHGDPPIIPLQYEVLRCTGAIKTVRCR